MDRRLALFGVGLVWLTTSVFGQGKSFLKVGTAMAVKGQKSTGFIEVPVARDSALSIPVVVINGSKPGPTLAIVSGAHGTEYASIIAVERLMQELSPTDLAGAVILVPLVNVPSFQKKVPHLNPLDGKSMNRMYPGTMDGTQTERASFLMTKEVVGQCDHLIDLHGGDLDENLRPYSYWTKTGNENQDRISREMVLAFGLDHIIISADRPKDPNASRYLENTATTRGKPSITVEAGYAGTVETDDVNVLVDGCKSVMRYLGQIAGKVKTVEHPVWIGKVVTVASAETGIFYPLVRKGTYAVEGMRIGYVTDYFGNLIFDARSTASGVVLYICSVPSMMKGETVANIGVLTPEPK